MRVITGTARGKRLKTLEGVDVRPTSDRVKEAIFSILHFDIEGSAVLDLFSGTGQLGIEALSRGARHVTFVDSSKRSLDVTKQNIDFAGFADKSRTVQMDGADFIKGTNTMFDIVLLDPPYNKDILPKVMPLVSQKMNDCGIIVCEHEKGLKLNKTYGNMEFFKEYSYGKIIISLFKAKED